MKIAIPEFMEMVSPRFDCCEKITLFKIENWKIKEANDYHFASTGLKEKKELLDSQGVKILI